MLPRAVVFGPDGKSVAQGCPANLYEGKEGHSLKVMFLPGDNPEFIDYNTVGKTEAEIQRDLTPIATLADLCQFFGVETPDRLSKAVYKGTECGAWIALCPTLDTPDDDWLTGSEIRPDLPSIVAFKIGTIVEGSDVGIDGRDFYLPVQRYKVDEWLEEMEAEAARLWENANYDWFTVNDGDKIVATGHFGGGDTELDDEAEHPGMKEAITAAKERYDEEVEDDDGSTPGWDESQSFPVTVGDKTYTLKGYVPENF
jgi:hypothetical protein